MNRLVRDAILARALDMIDSAALDQKDRPGGTIHVNALSIYWLQDGLDLFHRAFPWTGIIATAALVITGSTNTYALPSDYTLDVRDGVRLMETNVKRRLHRRSLSWFLNMDTTIDAAGVPAGYVIIGTNLLLHPWPNTAYTGQFWYYKLPAVLASNERPNFPDDWTLVEYVRLRGKEWTGEAEASSAITYARKIIGELKKSGLGEESENDALELDSAFFRPTGSPGYDGYGWMGEGVAR